MPGAIIDGKELAGSVREEVKVRAEDFEQAHGRKPCLHVVLVGDDPASQVYVRSKERAARRSGIEGRVHRLPVDTSEDELLSLIDQLNGDDGIDGILIQLPLPDHLHDQTVVDTVDPRKDVDGLHPTNSGLLVVGRAGLRPCTPSGCMRMLDSIGYDLKGKRALVIGRSTLVGKPIALMLLERHATVTMSHSRTIDLEELVRGSDVIVAAVGMPGLVKGDWVKDGAVVIDVGMNRLEDGSLTGDVEFTGASEHAAWITPVPGGVGPMTIAMLLSNTIDAAFARVADRRD